MSPILELRNINKTYEVRKSLRETSEAHVLRNVSFSIEEGTTLGLVGESGSGKTTATRMALLMENPTSGDIFYRGKNVKDFTSADKKRFHRDVQIVFQDPFSSIDPSMKVGKSISEPLKIQGGYSDQEIKEKVRKVLSQVGLAEDYAERYPSEFSGGQLQRIAIARALISEPSLIVFDEPVSALDVSVRGQIMNLLKSIQISRHTAYLFISHDMISVGFLSTRIAVMYFGSIVEYGSADQVLNRYVHPYTQLLIESGHADSLSDRTDTADEAAEIPSHENPPKGCPFATRCPYAMERCLIEIPSPKAVGKEHESSCFLNDDSTKAITHRMELKEKEPDYYI